MNGECHKKWDSKSRDLNQLALEIGKEKGESRISEKGREIKRWQKK